MADLPLINTETITKIIKLCKMEGKIILAPTLDNGTSILCFNKRVKFPFLFGKNSSLRFKEKFREDGLDFELLEHEEAYNDIDTFKDLLKLSELKSIPEWLKKILESCNLHE